MRRILLTPGPVEVSEQVLHAMARPPISHRSPEFSELLEAIVERLKDIYSTQGHVTVLPGGGTTAVDAMVHSFVGRNSRVLGVAAGEFGERMAESARRTGALVDVVSFSWGDPASVGVVEERVDAGAYDVVLIVHNETSTGMLQSDLEELARRLCGRVGAILVDAVSSLGAAEIRVDEWCLDAVASASHKALGSVPGVSFVAVGEDSLGKMRGSPALGMDLRTFIRFYEERRQTPYTPAINALYALDKALEIVEEKGIDAWIRMYRERASMVYREATRLGVKPLVSLEQYRSPTVAVFKTPPGVDAGRIVKGLADRGFIIGRGMGPLRDKTVRMGLMGAISSESLVEAVRSMAEIVHKLSQEARTP
ncbi:MAG: alanine--glyoxylate aminotransferase family protein [Desulfurococcales archaeon]|nr:alanine--glyoxylate aminotransferase family protein [Desulfurococcales archaeon]